MLLLGHVVMEAQEVLRRHRISPRHRVVERVFGSMDQRLMVRACQEEGTLDLIPEIGDCGGVELFGTRQEALVARRFKGIDEACHEAAMVVEIGWQLRLSIFVTVQEASVAHQMAQDELDRALGVLPDALVAEQLGGIEKGRDHQPIPGYDDLFIAMWLHPSLTGGEELLPPLGE